MTASSPPWTIRRPTTDDAPAILELLTASFGEWPRIEIAVDPIEHLRWKLSSPGDALAYSVVAEAGGRLIGSRLFLKQQVKIGARLVSARHEVDSVVHPDYQQQGLMRDMSSSRQRVDRSDLYLCMRTGMEAWARIGWNGDGPFTPEVEVLACDPASPYPTAPAERTWQITQPDRFDDRMQAFWEDASQPFNFIVVRTPGYLNWRYCDRRAGLFSLRIAEQEGTVLGYAVLGTSREAGYIADLLALPARHDVVSSLLESARQFFTLRGVSRIDCWVARRHPYRDNLLAYGFTKKRRTIGLRCNQDLMPRGDLAFLQKNTPNFHLTAGDTDLV